MASPEADGELLRRVAGRDPHAFERLYRRYARPVYGLALRRLGEADGAAHATRRAFAAIRAAAAASAAGGDEARWVFAVAAGAIGDQAPSEDDWLAFRVHAAVADLPERERRSLERAYWGDGGPSGAVRADARSALLRLAATLDGAA
jgi:DNA-directed RNA polymerase specialized sigma24 family protein